MRIVDINPTTAAAMPPAELGVQRPGPCIHELFEQQVERHPDAVAVVHDGESLTYRELDDRANRLAHHLRSLGVGPDVLVGLCLERGLNMIVGLLGILKAGGAYVPLDPSYPRERLAVMLDDAAVPVLVTERALLIHLPPITAQVVCLDEPVPVREVTAVDAYQSPGAGPDNLAYVIFTSGSTGRPKGALITHRNVVRLMQATQPWFRFDERDVWTMFHSVAFDFSVWEIYGALLYGGRLVIVPYLVSRSPDAFYDLLVAEQVTVLNQTPTAFEQLMRVDAENDGTCHLALRFVIFGGEKLQMSSLAAWFARHGDVYPQLVNMYGITETTVHVTYRPLIAADVGAPSMIGVPIPDLQVHLLDEGLKPVAEGVPGELFVGGAGVARGYLNRPELTAERFIPDAFRDDPHARLYRTGDRGRRLPGGDIEYLGRADDQLKIRGFRIEPGEIEAALLQVEGVRQAAVVPRDVHPGDTRLLACLVGQSGTVADETIRAALSQALPDHMLPARYVWLESMPLTASGKLDRRALPAWSAEAVSQNAAEVHVAPRTPLEQKLAATWCDLLGLEAIGVHDNFFELGGDSLTAMQLVASVRQLMGVKLHLAFFFARPTLAELAEAITAAGDGARADIKEPALRVDHQGAAGTRAIPATAAQKRIWFLQQLASDSAVYTIILPHRVRGPLDVAALGSALNRIVARHESLRTTFTLTDGDVLQNVSEAGDWPLETVAAAGANASDREVAAMSLLRDEFQRTFDLEHGPLVRCRVVRMAADELILGFFIHHVIFDGWSVGVLYRELAACYQAILAGREPALPPLVQGSSVIAQKTAGSESSIVRVQEHYWRSQLADAPTHLTLPTDRPRPPVESFRGALVTTSLDPAVTAKLFALARSESSTPFSVLLASFVAVLGYWSDADDLVVGTPYADRERPDDAGVIGFLVNTLAIRVDLSGNPSFRQLLARVRTSLLGAFAHAELPFERVVELLETRRDASRAPVFQVMCAWQNDSDAVCPLPGLATDPLVFDGGVSHFDMTLFAVRNGSGIALRLEYATDLFESATALRMLDDVAALLAMVAVDPDCPIGRMPLAGPPSQMRISGQRVVTPEIDVALAADGLPSTPVTVCTDRKGSCRLQDAVVPRTLLELEIARIWQRLIGCEHIDRTADFFEIGGHSLLVAQLAVELERLLGHRVPVATLFLSPTVESLSLTLANESWLPAWTSLVPLKPTGSRAPLYLLHGLGGDVMHFVGFSRLLAADQPVYGVRAVDVDGRLPPLSTLDEMAVHYAREIRAFQPVGPYRLGGYSLAGCMAWAVAMELRGQGQEVTVLIFDTLPKFRLPWAASCVRALIKPLMLLSELGSRGVRQWPWHVAARLEEFLRPAYLAAPQGPRDAVVADRPQVVWKDRYFMAVMPFSGRPITARVELFLCQEPFMQRLMSWGIATIWRLLTQGPVNVHKLQYRHEDIFSNDTLPRVAALVDKVLADDHRPESPVGGRS